MPGLMTFSRDAMSYNVVFALAVCLACSVVVASSAVYLKPLQVANAKADKRRNILEVAGLYAPGMDVNAAYNERIEARVVNLETGEYAEDVDPASFDQRQAARDPQRNVDIPRDRDIAGIKRRGLSRARRARAREHADPAGARLRPVVDHVWPARPGAGRHYRARDQILRARRDAGAGRRDRQSALAFGVAGEEGLRRKR
jgi:hypothetical protein